MELQIVKHPDEDLHKSCADVDIMEITDDLVESMFKIMLQNHGVGLAAPQIGINKRFFIYAINQSKNNLKVVINPKILGHGKSEDYFEEGCLSVPGQKRDLKRWQIINVQYMTKKNGKLELVTETLKRWEARVFQHEFDHLEGILCMFKNEN